MSALQSGERVVDGIIQYIKDNFDVAAQALRDDRVDGKVKTVPFYKYYISPRYDAFRSPSCYVLIQRANYQPDANKANYVSGKTKVTVRVVVEEKDSELLMRAAFRYEAILKKILDQTTVTVNQSVLTGGTGLVKLFLVITEVEYSNVFVNEKSTDGVFRQAVDLSVECRHVESL